METFNVYVCPRSFGPLNEPFVCSPSSVHFLARHGFDFNKVRKTTLILRVSLKLKLYYQFIRDGVGYLNGSQESLLRSHLNAGEGDVERNVDHDEEDVLREVCNEVAEWVRRVDKEDKEEQELPVDCGGVSRFLMLQEIRRRCPGVWTFKAEEDENVRN